MGIMSDRSGQADVLIAGAGPTGLVLAVWLKGARAARIPLGNLGQGLTPFAFPTIFPQDEHERLLIMRLRELGVEVERPVELTGFEEIGGEIRATLRKAESQETCTYAYLAGCDGARSKVREVLNSGFPGGTYDHLFYVADVEAAGLAMNGELHVDLDDADFLAVFPRASPRRQQLSRRARLPAGRRRSYSQSGRRPRNEHRHRRCGQSGLETGCLPEKSIQ
jgi:2-polyprenyl-6-methoxyphenol hydroxylase-like FAD-dependent oxidoreductase